MFSILRQAVFAAFGAYIGIGLTTSFHQNMSEEDYGERSLPCGIERSLKEGEWVTAIVIDNNEATESFFIAKKSVPGISPGPQRVIIARKWFPFITTCAEEEAG